VAVDREPIGVGDLGGGKCVDAFASPALRKHGDERCRRGE
jgi:hypothetical protein